MHFSKKICAKVGLAVSLACATSVAQAGVVSYTMSGTITSGVDQLGIFGAPHNTLVGQRFTQTITTDLIGMNRASNEPGRNYLINESNGHHFSGMTSVNGNNFTWSVQANEALVAMTQQYRVAEMSIFLTGGNNFTPDGYILNAVNAVASSEVPFMNNVDMYQNHSFDPTAPGIQTGALFRVERDAQITYFLANADSLAWTAAPVPEPETYALMLLGLVGLGLAARRKKAGAIA